MVNTFRMFDSLMVFLTYFLKKKIDYEKHHQTTISQHENNKYLLALPVTDARE